MKKIILFLFLIPVIDCFGQNYRVFEWNVPHFFEGPNDIKAIKIDSVDVIGGDSVFYNFFSIDEAHPDSQFCTNIFGPSWIGQKIIVPGDSLNILFKYDGDSIIIRPLDIIGSAWKMMDIDSADYIKATVTSISQTLINGMPDSVKSIQLQAINNISGLPVNNLLNNKLIILSRSHGFFQLLPFRDLADDSTTFVLNDSLGLTNNDVFNFDIGDTIQYEYYLCYPPSPCSPYNYKTKVVTNKTLLPLNNVQYDFWIQDVMQTLMTDSSGTHLVTNISVSTSTESHSLNDTLIFRTMPEETDTFSPGIASRYSMQRGNCGVIQAFTRSGDYNFNPTVNCYFTFEPDIDEFGYIAGLGIASTSHYGCSPCGNFSYINKINAYKKVSSGCGGNIQLFNYVHEISENDFRIYPNPIDQSHYLNIEKKSNIKSVFKLIDLSGKVILEKELTGNLTSIDIQNISNGFYLYQISTDQKSYLIGKLIK